MRAFDQGSFYRVTASGSEVYDFARRWPCSGLRSCRGVSATFNRHNGDLVDIAHPGGEDGPALVALIKDMQAYGKRRMGKRRMNIND